MKTAIQAIFMAVWILMTQGCVMDDFPPCQNGRGTRITEEIITDDFNEIRLAIAADLFITQGANMEIKVTAQANILDELDFRIRNDALVIESDRCLRDYKFIEIFISVPEFRSLSIIGSGAIIAENTIVGDHIDLNIMGSGKMDLGLDANKVEATISGSGDMILEGLSIDATYLISGSGDIQAFDLRSENVEIVLSGSGDAELWVEKSLEVRISGSGSVYYRGNPSMDLGVSGSGNVVDAN